MGLHKKSRTAVAVAADDGKEDIIILQKNICSELEGHDILVKIKACSLSSPKTEFFGDILKVVESKSYGTDISGIVEGIGIEVTTLKVGDHVTGVIPLDYQQSGCGEYVRLHEYDLVQKPHSINFVDAAACIGDSVRAYIALFCCTKVNSSDVLLVLNGAAPCSSICIQLARTVGAKVITTCMSKDEKIYLQTLSNCIDEVIDLSNEDNIPDKLYNVCMKKTDNVGVDIILDIEADQQYLIQENERSRFDSNHIIISCLSVGGRWITTDSALQLDPPDSKNLLLRSGSICFINEQAWLMSGISQGRYQHILRDIVIKLSNNMIRPYVHHTVGFEELPHAVNTLSKHKVGKVVLRID